MTNNGTGVVLQCPPMSSTRWCQLCRNDLFIQMWSKGYRGCRCRWTFL